MAKEFFKNLPSQETPFNASRWNGLLNGEESMGSIVVEDIECKNVLNKYLLMNSEAYTVDLGNDYKGYKLQLKPNTTYTISIYYNGWVMSGAWEYRLFDSNKSFKRIIQSSSISTTNNIGTFTTDNTGIMYFGVLYGSTDRLQSFFSEIDIQLEKGSTATNVVEHKEFENKEIYSTSEQVIGIWIDGKPLYKKVINIGLMPNATSSTIAHNISSVDMIRTNGSFGIANGYSVPIPNASAGSTTNGQISINVDRSNIYLTTNSNRSDLTGYIILEYTKTTD